jgi:uncharacterized protein DUF6220
MSETVMGLPAGYRTTFAKIMRILAMATGTLAVVQFALAGFGAFGTFNKQRNWGPHETLGTVIGVFALLVLVAAIVSRPTRPALVASIVMFLLAGPIQPILADTGKDHGAWWGALHALCGVAILATTGVVSRKIDARSTGSPTPVAAA